MKNKKKKKNMKFRVAVSLLLSAIFSVFLMAMLLHKPKELPDLQKNNKEVSTYVTHYLAQELYNGAQRQQPFSINVTESGINELLAFAKWPVISNGSIINTPRIQINDKGLNVRSIIERNNIEFSLAADLSGKINDKGKMDCEIKSVKLGMVDITFLAKKIAASFYKKAVRDYDQLDRDQLAQLAGALFGDSLFDPVFLIEDKYIRASQLEFRENAAVVYFEPVPKNKLNL